MPDPYEKPHPHPAVTRRDAESARLDGYMEGRKAERVRVLAIVIEVAETLAKGTLRRGAAVECLREVYRRVRETGEEPPERWAK